MIILSHDFTIDRAIYAMTITWIDEHICEYLFQGLYMVIFPQPVGAIMKLLHPSYIYSPYRPRSKANV